MNRLIMVSIAFAILVLSDAYPQEQRVERSFLTVQTIKAKHMFGTSGSTVSGAGFSYMYYATPNYHLKITGLPYQEKREKTGDNDEKDYDNYTIINGDIELRRNFAVVNRTNVSYQFYNLAGGSYWYYKKEKSFHPEDDKLRRLFIGGVGLGTGFVFANRISLNLDLFYQYTHWIGNKARYTGPGGGISCYYIF